MNDLAKLERIVEEGTGLLPSVDRRGRASAPLMLEHQRDLTEEDLRSLAAAKGHQGVKPPSIKELRHSHHLLARLLAEGKSNEEASLLTGYDPARISILKNSPAFEELISYYSLQESAKEVDFRLRVAAAGLDFVEEMHKRLQDDPDEISFKEVRESAESLLTMSGLVGVPTKGAMPTGGPALNFNISFVAPATPSTAEVSVGQTIEGEAEKVS